MVEIPDDVAKAHALRLRALGTQGSGTGADAALADLLDPKPRTLRDEARAVVPEQWQADAVLAAVKASLDALPMTPVRLGEDHLIAGQFTQTTKRDDIDALFGGTS